MFLVDGGASMMQSPEPTEEGADLPPVCPYQHFSVSVSLACRGPPCTIFFRSEAKGIFVGQSLPPCPHARTRDDLAPPVGSVHRFPERGWGLFVWESSSAAYFS